MRRVLLVWWFTWLTIAPSGAVTIGPADRVDYPTQAECQQARDAMADALERLLRAHAISGFEVHSCETLDREPR